jgi:PAS domain S-box-containing protein
MCLTEPREVLPTFQIWQPDLLLLDLAMPDMDGFAVMEQLRPLIHEGDYLPIVVITADINPATRQRALSSGATDFLTKPLDTTEVLLRLRNLLETRFLYKQLRDHNRRLEEAVRERTREVREQATLIAKARDAIVVQDLEGKIRFWNEGAVRLYGWTAEETLGCEAHEVLFRRVVPELRQAEYAIREKGEWAGEFVQVTRDGREVAVESHWSLVSAEQGEAGPEGAPGCTMPEGAPGCTMHVLMINTDITEKKQLEAQYLRAQRLECIGMLAGGIAHDLNNMLTPILLGIDLLKISTSEGHRQSLLETLRSSVERGAGFVHQILSFARGNARERLPLPVGPIVKETGKLLEQGLPKSVTVEVSLPSNLWMVRGEATHLAQILVNLCVNARDAMPQGGHLRIRAENVRLGEADIARRTDAKPGPHVRIEVSDTGTGMTPEVLNRIFDPFFTTKEAGKGTGLGLTTVQRLVKGQNGFIEVATEVGKGSCFAVHLPAVEVGVEDRTGPARPAALPTGKGELVLVVDDEASIRQLAETILTSHGYRVVTACDGAEAVGVYGRHFADNPVVVTDLMMPVMDGAATIRALRAIRPEVKVVVMSGTFQSSQVDPRESGLDAQAFLEKPYTAQSLLQTVRGVIRGQKDDTPERGQG